jgi:hypothetical protein
VALALIIWVVAQDFGAILTRSATDPNSGLMLALLAAAYWPAPAAVRAPLTSAQPALASVSGAQNA